MYSVGQDIAGIDDRVVVKVPVTADGVAAAARLKRQKAQVTATSVYSSRQALAAVGVGADFIAPYLGRMNRGGRNVRLETISLEKAGHQLCIFAMNCLQDLLNTLALLSSGNCAFGSLPRTAWIALSSTISC